MKSIKDAIKEVGLKTYLQMCLANKRLLSYADVWEIVRGE